MSKISNQSAYPVATPVSGDYLIGTDVSDSNATKTFTVGSIAALAPADTLSAVLTAGNTATNNIILTGNITCTTIIPTDIQDAAGNTGTVGQHLVKNAANALEWGAGSADTLANVLTAGNTATNDINLTGNITLTNGGTPGVGSIVMSGSITAATGTVSAVGFQASSYFQGALLNATDIQDVAGNTGTAGQYLRKSAGNALAWETVGTSTLSEVLTAGNTATNNIVLTGNISCTNLTATTDVNGSVVNATTQVSTALLDATDIQDNANLNGTAGQYLRKSAANALAWETVVPSAATLSDVLTSGNTATNNINLTGDLTATNLVDGAGDTGSAGQYLRKSSPGNVLAWETVAVSTLSTILAAGNTATNNIVLTGDFTGTGNITRTGDVTITGDISGTNVTATTDIEASGMVSAGTNLKGIGTNALQLPNLNSFADNAAAVAGGLAAGDVYQTDGTAAAPLNVAGILMVRQ